MIKTTHVCLFKGVICVVNHSEESAPGLPTLRTFGDLLAIEMLVGLMSLIGVEIAGAGT